MGLGVASFLSTDQPLNSKQCARDEARRVSHGSDKQMFGAK